METESSLRKLGWKKIFEKSWKNGNRFVEYDDEYVDIYTWNDGEKDKGYLTIEEYKLFYYLILAQTPIRLKYKKE